ncbi:putative transcriptional regulator [Rhodovulum sp. PH10]|uniref:type II toxin-antitoxin system ParD family antitoxin n=1 Tax=Rhodovulum sp. PH10 TaxID=1187851 RepID=UPI00027C2812|nr:type II toxin-antitoxin system ParD family antitoxin [Rhodovulum sp. PH10]EJW10713.1 putative transcriptional regulator [Rhodovulum sp. PH10]
MANRTISFTAEQDAFIDRTVATGDYQDASEVVRDAVRVLQQRREEDELRRAALRLQLEAGTQALDRGDWSEIADADLDRWLDELSPRAG